MAAAMLRCCTCLLHVPCTCLRVHRTGRSHASLPLLCVRAPSVCPQAPGLAFQLPVATVHGGQQRAPVLVTATLGAAAADPPPSPVDPPPSLVDPPSSPLDPPPSPESPEQQPGVMAGKDNGGCDADCAAACKTAKCREDCGC
jgi:hypothetical protein